MSPPPRTQPSAPSGAAPRAPRALRLIALFWSTAISAELEYRVNFALSTLTSLGNLAGSLFGLFLFYRTGYRFAGWSWEEALVVLGVFTFLEGVTSAFLAPNLGGIVRHVRQGTLDFVLLRPVDTQLWLSTRALSPWGLPDILFGLGLVAFAAHRLALGPADILWGIPPLALAVVSLYSLWFILATTSIWFVKIYNVTEVLRTLVEAGRFPISGYPAVYRAFFTFVVPVAFLTTVPAEALLGRAPALWIIASAGLAVGLFVASRLFLRLALRSYTSASS